jgi:hypothetical protein
MATLTLPYGKEVDLDDVADMDADEFNGLLAYAGQWDTPDGASAVVALNKARGGDSDDGYEDVEEGYATMTNDELKAELEARDLPVSGNKHELVERLEAHDAASE